MLEASHRRGQAGTRRAVDDLVAHLNDGTWRRRARRVANLQAVLAVFVVAAVSMACMPHPSSDDYYTTSLTATLLSDIRDIDQMFAAV